jgi:DNA invertase Pin-like site-specific DNA recombinase
LSKYVVELPPYYDAAVSGADPIEGRPGFAAMIAYMADHTDVRTILFENAERFARELMVQEIGYEMLREQGIILIAVDSPESCVSNTPTAVLIRQIRGAVSQFEKATIVLKLRLARDRKRLANGKCEGRKSHAELRPAIVDRVRALDRQNPRTHKRMPLRKIAAVLAKEGHLTPSGKMFSASAIFSMTGRTVQRKAA